MKRLIMISAFLISSISFGQIIVDVPSKPCPAGASEALYANGKKLSDNVVNSLEGVQVEHCSFNKKREVFALKYLYNCQNSEVIVHIDYVMCEPNTARVKSFTVKNTDK